MSRFFFLPVIGWHCLRYFQYDGSFTTPGCTEGVEWTVIGDICEVPQSVVDWLHTLDSMEANYRDIQPLNSRTISGFHWVSDVYIWFFLFIPFSPKTCSTMWPESLETLERLFEKIFKIKIFLYCWATFWQHFFIAATNTNKKQEIWKNMVLLLLLVLFNI